MTDGRHYRSKMAIIRGNISFDAKRK